MVVNRYGQIRAEDEYGEYWIPTNSSRQLSAILHDRSKNRLARLYRLDKQFDFELRILRRLFMLFGAEIAGN